MIVGIDRFTQPLQSEFDIIRLQWRQLSTAVRYRSFGNLSKYSFASMRAADRSRVNFSRMKGSCGIPNPQSQPGATNEESRAGPAELALGGR